MKHFVRRSYDRAVVAAAFVEHINLAGRGEAADVIGAANLRDGSAVVELRVAAV